MILPINPTINRDQFTDDEFYEFCLANPDFRIERDKHGQIYFEMPTGTKTSFRNADLVADVVIWNRQTRSGRVSESNGGYKLPDGSTRAPDVAWVSHERWNVATAEEQDKFAQICPDFALELASDKYEVDWLRKKMKKYLRNGVRLGWIVDPFAQQTIVFRPDHEPLTVPFTEALTGYEVMPGFSLLMSELME